MKLKFIAAACVALGASVSFAVPRLGCDTTTAVTMVNTCTPEVTLFVVGSSSLGDAVKHVVQTDLFAAIPTLIKDVSNNPQAGSTSAWYGLSKAELTSGVSKRLFVVYDNNNGSGAGVSQLLAKLSTVAEADVVTVGPIKNSPNTCVAGYDEAHVNCTAHGFTQADVAISDVHPMELYKLYTAAFGGLGWMATAPLAPQDFSKLTSLTATPLALQGFGIAVNASLYYAMQAAQGTTGQPSIRSADYASLVTKAGSIKSAAALLGNSDTSVLTLARRDDLSGTQAASNIFFAANPCGNNRDAKGKMIEGVQGGELGIISSADSTDSLVVQINNTTDMVKTSLSSPYYDFGYVIGVLSLNVSTEDIHNWRFIKLDGVSPDFNANGSAAYKQRTTIASGDYPFAMTAFAVTPVKATGVAKAFPDVIPTLIAGLKDSTLHDLTGIAYLDGVADGSVVKQSHVHRTNGNNCSPLIK